MQRILENIIWDSISFYLPPPLAAHPALTQILPKEQLIFAATYFHEISEIAKFVKISWREKSCFSFPFSSFNKKGINFVTVEWAHT